MDKSYFTEELKVLFKNYPFTTTKLYRGFNNSIFYKRMVKKFNRDLLSIKGDYEVNIAMIPYIQDMSIPDFEMLCRMNQAGKLDKFVKLIKEVSE